MSSKEMIDLLRLPSHIAIIMDGNGRWAEQRGMHRIFGHEYGVESVRQVSEACAGLGVKYLTLYAFSTENWNRPRPEVDALMSLLIQTLHSEIKTLQDNQIRLQAIGDLESLACYPELMHAIRETAGNSKMTLTLALSYSARWEIAESARKIARDVKAGLIQPEEVDERTITEHLTTAAYPDPELLIRTSGEYRISNFLLWQIAYAELFFSPKYWPDFSKEDLYEAIISFQHRERRFGKTSAQLKM